MQAERGGASISRLVASYFYCRIGRVVTPSSCVFRCIIGTSCNIVLSDIRLGERWFQLAIVLIDGDWAVPQQRHSWQPSQIISLLCHGK